MRMLYNALRLFWVLTMIGGTLQAQESSSGWGTNYPAVPERFIAATKWKYTYTLHVESNTIIHQADDSYRYFIHFRYDYIYEQFLNDEMTRGRWALDGSMLDYSFRHIGQFEVAEVNKKLLVLEFKQANSKGTYRYYYLRVEHDEAPFIKPRNELPDVVVETADPRKRGWLSFGKKSRKKRRKLKRDQGDKYEEKDIYISIELIGGGYYGGVDPVLRDYIHIKSNGRLIKEYKSVNQGLQVVKKNISREELEQFAEYIIEKKFFEFDQIYDCDNNLCKERKRRKPTPIPLRLAVAYGSMKKVVTISIWGKEDKNYGYVEYPAAIDHIIEAIQTMAHRIEPES